MTDPQKAAGACVLSAWKRCIQENFFSGIPSSDFDTYWNELVGQQEFKGNSPVKDHQDAQFHDALVQIRLRAVSGTDFFEFVNTILANWDAKITGSPNCPLKHDKGPAKVAVSAENLVKLFKESGFPLKSNLRQPNKLARNLPQWKPVSREKAMAKMYAHMADRHITKTHAEQKQDKQNNPLACSHGSKGLGKSFFTDMVCEFQPEDIEKYTPKELSSEHRQVSHGPFTSYIRPVVCFATRFAASFPYRSPLISLTSDAEAFKQKLKGAYAITISYTDLKWGCQLDTECPRAGFALRVLYSFFVDQLKLAPDQSWNTFCQLAFPKFSDWQCFNLDMALAAVRLAVNDASAYIFLGVDDLAAAVGHIPTQEAKHCALSVFLTDIGNSLDNDDRAIFDALVTQADQVLFAEFTRQSHRYFDWIQLTALDVLKMSDTLPYFSDPAIRRIYADCSGHPRSLEVLYGILTGFQHIPTAARLRDLLVERLPVPSLTLGLITPALLGRSWNLTDVPDITIGKSFNTLVAEGVYIYSYDPANDSAFIPMVSGIALHRFATSSTKSANARQRMVGALLQRMLDTDLRFQPAFFETWHANFEVLRSVLNDGKQTSLHLDYPGAWKQERFSADTFKYKVTAPPVIDIPTLEHWFPGRAPDAENKKQKTKKTSKCARPPRRVEFWPPCTKDGELVDLCDGVVVIPAKGNRGFGIVRVVKKLDGKPAVINIEVRFSEAEAKTTFSLESVTSKATDTFGDYRAHMAELRRLKGLKGLKEENIVHVYATVRKAASDVQGSIPSRTLVLDRETLLKLYGPTLSSRPQFVADDTSSFGTRSSSFTAPNVYSISTDSASTSTNSSRKRPRAHGQSKEEESEEEEEESDEEDAADE